jgi:hypothetical protein
MKLPFGINYENSFLMYAVIVSSILSLECSDGGGFDRWNM